MKEDLEGQLAAASATSKSSTDALRRELHTVTGENDKLKARMQQIRALSLRQESTSVDWDQNIRPVHRKTGSVRVRPDNAIGEFNSLAAAASVFEVVFVGGLVRVLVGIISRSSSCYSGSSGSWELE